MAYAIIPDMGGVCSFACQGNDSISNVIITASHLIAGEITDPAPPGPDEKAAKPAAWISFKVSDIGDLCSGKISTLKTSTQTYVVQDEWDNSTKAYKKGVFQ